MNTQKEPKIVSQRKLKITLLSLLLLTAGYIACGFLPGLDQLYGAYAASVLAASHGYGGLNILNKHIVKNKESEPTIQKQ